jgi:hypothetical protein
VVAVTALLFQSFTAYIYFNPPLMVVFSMILASQDHSLASDVAGSCG